MILTFFNSRRSVATGGGVDFRRQLAERDSAKHHIKKFRSTAAPKGVKLPSGYIDRTRDRVSEEEDDKVARVKALEEMMKLQQIDQPTFEKLRDEIIGGDVASVHLVKGLDYKLLNRVRKGEDVLNGMAKEAEAETDDVDVEEELEILQDRDVVPVAKEKAVKKGEMAPPSLVPGKKRNRDQILAELKAARMAAKEKAAPSLGAKFKKVGATATGPRIERDSKGREVLITVDEDGNEKRKVRKAQPDAVEEKGHGLLMPDKDAIPLGMEVPDIPKMAEEEEDIDIFEDAGDDYDPLAGLEGDDDSDAEDGAALKTIEKEGPDIPKSDITEKSISEPSSMPPPARPRNYFGDSKDHTSTSPPPSTSVKAMSDPTILAALKKASSLHAITGPSPSDSEEAAREARRKKMLQTDDRDAADLDMGFGSSRFEDEEDFEEKRVKLSEWGAEDGDGDGGGQGKGAKGKRKRGPKKRKGDGESAADVLRVIERRKGEKS
jgi:hypothetical protein